MQDLLNEKEFLQKPYNPWKAFYIFYVIAVIQFLLFFAISLIYRSEAGMKSLIVAVLLPDITALVMFFFKTRNALLPIKTMAIATGILFGIYYLPALIFSIIGGATVEDIITILAFSVANYLLCFGIMYLVMRSRQKKNPDTTSSKT
jgi:O-antigen ligase